MGTDMKVEVEGIIVGFTRYANGTTGVQVTYPGIDVTINHQVIDASEPSERLDPRPFVWVDQHDEDIDAQIRMGDAAPTGWA